MVRKLSVSMLDPISDRISNHDGATGHFSRYDEEGEVRTCRSPRAVRRYHRRGMRVGSGARCKKARLQSGGRAAVASCRRDTARGNTRPVPPQSPGYFGSCPETPVSLPFCLQYCRFTSIHLQFVRSCFRFMGRRRSVFGYLRQCSGTLAAAPPGELGEAAVCEGAPDAVLPCLDEEGRRRRAALSRAERLREGNFGRNTRSTIDRLVHAGHAPRQSAGFMMEEQRYRDVWQPTAGSPCPVTIMLVSRTVRCLCVSLASRFYRFLARFSGTAAAERLACSPPTKANRVQSSAGFSQVGILPDDAAVFLANFLGDLPFPPPLHSGSAPLSPHFIINSQELAVKSRPNLFTRSNNPAINVTCRRYRFHLHFGTTPFAANCPFPGARFRGGFPTCSSLRRRRPVTALIGRPVGI
ncbi:hypothetical protein PR048_029232 [Dryococelus australis]|uniref:Uncharacterized protein n=1 Tax=Dryococelus australis TaxID=614101 RepID=A0ABQ9GCW9_9NEOP|nr:hypothetical protein PR048_029232 [Dryococelus australis]